MVKHIILWKIKENISENEREKIKAGVKVGLEALKGKISGLLDIHVQTDSLESSTADIMLDSEFTDVNALKAYAVHPEHVKVADNNVRPFMEVRMCLDFEK